MLTRNTRGVPRTPPGGIPLLLAFLAALAGLPAAAQTTTGKVGGTVADEAGAPLPGVTVSAANTETGFKSSAVSAENGFYSLALPPGPYELKAASAAHQAQTRVLRVQIGQTADIDFRLKPGTTITQEVAVVAAADPVPELQTSEMSTNVTRDQIQSLPQITRNFLNAAVLAPGMRLSHDELRQEVSYGAQGSMNTNVFIDGASYKNDLILGGVVGQDSSRGNPFPQNAVQEFRVTTQNYKAEYQKASSAVINAVTKTGTNELHGDVFAYYQNKSLVAQDAFTAKQGADKPEYKRWQPGISLGGPIVKDKFHFFASYEGNYQDRESSVFLSPNASKWPASFVSQFQKYVGNFQSPFRASLFFGKLTATPGESSTLDFSGDLRHETDIRSFGQTGGNSQAAYDQAENVKNDVWTIRAKHTAVLGKYLNEATVSYQSYIWNPVQVGNGQVGQEYQDLLIIGGRPTSQDISQRRFALRDDVTLMSLQWSGDHVVKGGVTFDYLSYHVVKYQDANPFYHFRASTYINAPGDMPFSVDIGAGNPDLSSPNRELGLYIQDDWRINPRLTANVGIRWDYETDMLNNNYVTPAGVRAGFSSTYSSNYFTDGTNRPTFYGAFQPRVGLSYDISGDGKTVVHGGYGKYYDRTLFNDILDERFRLQWARRTIWFSKDGSPQDGHPATRWDPSYMTLAGLQALIASGQADPPETYLLDNNTKPPSSDQWSLGVRHTFGALSASLAYTGVYSKNQMTWTCGIKNPDGSCNWGARPAAGYGFSLLSRGKEGWFNSFQIVFDKAFTASSKWGATLSYVYGSAQQTGNDLFSWGTMDPVNGNKQTSPITQKHAIVATAIVGLPLGFKASGVVSLGSGYPFYVTDCSKGYDKCAENIGGGNPPKWTESVDLRLEKRFDVGAQYGASLFLDAINVFNYTNEQYYDGWVPALPDVNNHFGQAGGAYNPRRLQLGLQVSF